MNKVLECLKNVVKYIVKRFNKSYEWFLEQIDLLTIQGDFEAEHKIIMFFALTFLYICMFVFFFNSFKGFFSFFYSFKDFDSFFPFLYNGFIRTITIFSVLCFVIILILLLILTIFIIRKVWKESRKSIICFQATVYFNLITDILLVCFFLVRTFITKEYKIINYLDELLFYVMSTWYELWVISWFIDKIIIPKKYNNVIKYKGKIIVWKLIFMILVSVILYLMNSSDTLTIFSIIFTIIISMLDYKTLHVLSEMVSYDRLKRQQRIKLKRYCREKLIPIKIYMYLIEISYIIANSLVRFFEKMNNNLFYYNKISLIIILTLFTFLVLYFTILKLVRDIINDENKKD